MNRILSVSIVLSLVLAAGCAPRPEAVASPTLLPSPTSPPAPPPCQAVLSELRNTVLARPGPEAEWRAAAEGQPLEVGGSVETGLQAGARVDVSDGTLLRLAEKTLFQLQELSPLPADPVTRMVLEAGKVWVMVARTLGLGSFEVATPVGVATVRGSLISVEYAPTTEQMVVTCLEGACLLAGASGAATELQAGQQSEILGQGQAPTDAHAMPAGQLQAWSDNFPEAAPAVREITPAPAETPSATAAPGTAAAGSDLPAPLPTQATAPQPAATVSAVQTSARTPVDTPTPSAATAGSGYILSGGPDPGAGIFVDDILRLFVNASLAAEVKQGGRCCAPVPPIHFAASSGDSLRVLARDENNCYSLEALWLHKADGSYRTQLTGDIYGPNCGSEPLGQTFFDQTFTLP